MRSLWEKLCSPRHLMVFEAAARSGSFTRAAEELNVQQPAVSATIRALEDRLGVALFLRGHRRVTLTAAGERLFSDVSRAFEQLAHSATAIQHLSRRDYVTLNASTAFNNHWTMPRLAALKSAHPQIDLRLQTSDREPDLYAENISLAVRRGDGNWPDCESVLIARERIYPVAAPRVMAAAVNLKGIPGLLHQRLIHLEEPIRERPVWSDWFAHFGIRAEVPSSGLRLNDYALVLQAAMAGEGFAFGWHHVVKGLVDQGLLAARPDWSWRSGAGFYLVWSRLRPLSDDAKLVRDWILAQTKDAA
ncbi:transcriptional regulator [Roseovarius sp. JS7-11]|nr:LysR substrate-binding domain-containing protein [Nioella sediminis]TBX27727.1 transcriptional regulator [Roseovarius sp. JS7-11]